LRLTADIAAASSSPTRGPHFVRLTATILSTMTWEGARNPVDGDASIV